MSSTVIILIHVAILLAFAFLGFIMGYSLASTTVGVVIGLVVAAILYYVWGQKALQMAELNKSVVSPRIA